MPFNLLLFPLVGGYYLLSRLRIFRYFSNRLDRQRLIFQSVLTGVGLIVLAWSFRFLALSISPNFVSQVLKAFPNDIPHLAVSILSLVLGILITETINWLIGKEKSIQIAINLYGSELERLYFDAFKSRKLIQLNLENGKCYVGWLKELPEPSRLSHVRLTPVLSGYRDEQQQLKLTTQYYSVYSKLIREGQLSQVDSLDLYIILESSRIVSARWFDIDIYDKFNVEKKKK